MYPDENKLDVVPQAGLPEMVLCHQRPHAAVAGRCCRAPAAGRHHLGPGLRPQDYQQGNSFRIIYIHVPAAMLAQSCYVLLAVAGVVGLVWKMKLADVALQCAAPIGAWMTAVALVTGAIWGKPTWGSWWVWDARLTSMLILLFLYFGIIALGQAISNRDSAAKACAVLAIVGVVNIPIIKYSVEWWNTLHQGATFTPAESRRCRPKCGCRCCARRWVSTVSSAPYCCCVCALKCSSAKHAPVGSGTKY